MRTSNNVVSKFDFELILMVEKLMLGGRLVDGQVRFIMAGHSQADDRDDERFR